MKKKDEAKAREILAAAVEIAGEKGIAAVSMELVARRAGVATGTLYVYHPSKEALLTAAYLDAKRTIATTVFVVEDLPVRPAFLRMARRYLDFLVDHPELTAFLEQMRHAGFLAPEVVSDAESSAAPVVALLERGKRELLLKDVDLDLMMVVIHGILRESASLAPGRPAAFRQQSAAMCWDAVSL